MAPVRNQRIGEAARVGSCADHAASCASGRAGSSSPSPKWRSTAALPTHILRSLPLFVSSASSPLGTTCPLAAVRLLYKPLPCLDPSPGLHSTVSTLHAPHPSHNRLLLLLLPQHAVLTCTLCLVPTAAPAHRLYSQFACRILCPPLAVAPASLRLHQPHTRPQPLRGSSCRCGWRCTRCCSCWAVSSPRPLQAARS